MIGLLAVGSVVALIGLAVLTADSLRDRTRKVRRREFESALNGINDIDVIVSRYYLTTDEVGQAMCDEIRTIITEHRKESTCR
jgi:hypothetical protein